MLEKLQPKVFVLENVSGLVRGADFVNGCKRVGYPAYCKILHIVPGARLCTPISTHYFAHAQFLQLSAVSKISKPVGEDAKGPLLPSHP